MKKLYSSIVDTPMLAWHYFYKFFVIHNTLKDEATILEKIELFKDNEEQLKLWQMNLRILQGMKEKNTLPLDTAYGYLIPSNDFSETAAETRGKAKVKDKESICTNFYSLITKELLFKGFKDNSQNIELGINLKKYISELANDKDTTNTLNYFRSLQATEDFNVTNPKSWINRVDIEFYALCESLQQEYYKDVKQLTILEFFTRIKYLEKKYAKE